MKKSISRFNPQVWCVRASALIAFACLSWALTADAAPKKILFYGPTFEVGGVGDKMIKGHPGEFAQIGKGSAVWTPGDPNPANDWDLKTTTDFQAFDAIVIGDLAQGTTSPGVWFGAINNRAQWSAAVTANNHNILLYAEDPELHASGNVFGARVMIEQGIRFAASSLTAGPGLFITFSIIDPSLPSPVNPAQPCTADLLAGLDAFTLVPGSHDAVRKLASNPVTDCITEVDLGNWGQSSHSGFVSWPANHGWVPLAMVTDTPTHTDPSLLPPGEVGLVHLLAKGDVKLFTLSPAHGSHYVGQQHQVMARYLNAAGQGISGASVTFNVISGPNVSQGPVTVNTSGSGTAFWSYVGNGGVGTDTIVASVNNPSGCASCLPTATAVCDWDNQPTVSVSLDGPQDIYKNVQGFGIPIGGLTWFTITRSGSGLAPSLMVTFFLGGNPDDLSSTDPCFATDEYPFPDFTQDGANTAPFPHGHYVIFQPNQSSATIYIQTTDNVTEGCPIGFQILDLTIPDNGPYAGFMVALPPGNQATAYIHPDPNQ